jgi:hypothetical protein
MILFICFIIVTNSIISLTHFFYYDIIYLSHDASSQYYCIFIISDLVSILIPFHYSQELTSTYQNNISDATLINSSIYASKPAF